MSVDQLQRRFRQLKAHLQSGTIGQEQFEMEVQRLRYRDSRGLYWTIGSQTGQWYVYDGTTWVPRQPPAEQTAAGEPPVQAPPPPTTTRHKPAGQQRSKPVLFAFSCLGLVFLAGIAIAGVALVSTIASKVARPTPPALSIPTTVAGFDRFGSPEASVQPTNIPTYTPIPSALPVGAAKPALMGLTPTVTATLPVSKTEPITAEQTISPTTQATKTEKAAKTPTAEKKVADAGAEAKETPQQARPTKAAAPAKPTDTPTPAAPQPKLSGTIAYAVFGWDPLAKTNSFQIYLLKADGSGSIRFTSNASQVSLNANGNLITYKQWSSDSAGLVAGGISGGGFFRLTDKFEDALPSFSPDGQSVVMFSRRDGDRKSIIYPITAGGFSPDGSVRGINDGEYPFWMSNGQVVFKGWGVTAGGLRIMNPDGAGVMTLTNDGSDTAPSASRDAKTIAFMSIRDGNWEIYKINADGSGVTRLTQDSAADGLPAWSPDGLSIAFASNRGGQWAIWVMNADGSNQRKLWDMEGTPDALVPGQPDYVSKGWLEERVSWGGQ